MLFVMTVSSSTTRNFFDSHENYEGFSVPFRALAVAGQTIPWGLGFRTERSCEQFDRPAYEVSDEFTSREEVGLIARRLVTVANA